VPSDRYGVIWAERGLPEHVGELTIGPGYLAIDDRTKDVVRVWIPAEQVSAVRIGEAVEPLREVRAVAVDTRDGTLSIAPFETDRLPHLADRLGELAAYSTGAPLRLLVAGGGVAGVEALLAVHALAGDRVAPTLLAAEPEFAFRQLAVIEAFGGQIPRVPLDELCEEVDAELHVDRLASVDPERRVAHTAGGDELTFDVVLVALGAAPRAMVPDALTFWAGAGRRFRALLEDVTAGRVESVVFVAAEGTAWAMPLYELALLTAARAAAANRHPSLAIVTAEREPVAVLGSEASRRVAALLEERGIRLLANRRPARLERGRLVVEPDERLPADRIVALPPLEGPRVQGLPHDSSGFLPTDRFGYVGAFGCVLAAGDNTTFPVKQGGIAAQQAEVAARVVASRAGAPVTPSPFDPVVEAQLLTGGAPLFVRSKLEIGAGEESVASSTPLWHPPTKIAAPRLREYVAAHSETGTVSW
jgi:sulfide:quinone oxidoreductase